MPQPKNQQKFIRDLIRLIFALLVFFGTTGVLFYPEDKEAPEAPESPSETILNSQEALPEADNGDWYTVTQVVDGDTLKVRQGDTITTLRLIGIDTPESVDPRKPVQCFGEEASNRAKELLAGKKVSLEKDDSQGNLDKYQRSLRYVHLEDGTFFNLRMIQQGYAHEYTYDTPYRYQKEFKEAQLKAAQEKKGFWGDTTCRGNTTGPKA